MVSKNQQKNRTEGSQLHAQLQPTQVTLKGNGVLLTLLGRPIYAVGPSLPTERVTQVTAKNREMPSVKTGNCVLWTFSGRPIYSHLALGGRVMN